ncbi:MAG: hypothetical protein B7Z10_02630 [Rhodobacterales bacterium 32-66-7]|nr:MAG: hypothetical protein B7Z31_05900 [Rhodobacterales bacterium 12-65-15]OYX26689.1 MAG: hypothetical protein B7Z10_02630 [Rhodobacterales bacterium 32-66-7]
MEHFWPIVIGLAVAAFCVDRALAVGRGPNARYDLPIVLLLLLAAAALWGLSLARETNNELIAGLLIAAFALFGLLYNAAVGRDAENQLRAERKSDLCRALRAEIDAHVREFETFNWDTALAATGESLRKVPRFLPFLPLRTPDRVYSEVLGRIEVLDKQQIENVIRYYTLSDRVAQFIRDLRSEEFKSLNPQRKLNLFKTYIEMDRTLVRYGLEALASLGDTSATKRAEIFNTPGPDRSVPAGEG